MNMIRKREELGRNVVRYVVDAPLVATHRKPGQFVIIRVTDHGERIPLTIANANPEMGTISLIVQSVGKTTREMAMLRPGNAIHDIVGPLGRPTHIQRFGTVLCMGGGIGIAPLYPIAKGMKEARNHVIRVLGARKYDPIITVLSARTYHLLIRQNKMRNVIDDLIFTTHDLSHGTNGLVTDAIRSLV